MKHGIKITLILLGMFLLAQFIGLYVSYAYQPAQIITYNETTQAYENHTQYNLPYGLNPPEEVDETMSVFSIVIALVLAVLIMLGLMKLKAETFLRGWFFIVVSLGIAVALNAFLSPVKAATIIAILIAVPLAYLKIFKRNLWVHNITELLIYPGIATIFIPLLNLWGIIILLIIISLYDMYAVWHAGFMQKMAKYQIEKLRIFSGFFIPYVGKKNRILIQKARTQGKHAKKVSIHIAILGGGDVVFPIILAGVVLSTWGLIPALIIPIGAALALASLFLMSQKGKFYPAMPFITIGCFIALGIAYLIH